ncbi:hypothetical protein D3C87_1318290 [compost metagenome]
MLGAEHHPGLERDGVHKLRFVPDRGLQHLSRADDQHQVQHQFQPADVGLGGAGRAVQQLTYGHSQDPDYQ